MSDKHYIGRVHRARRHDAYHYASVEPLIESDAGGTRWERPVESVMEVFPRRGLVHWHDAPPSLQLESLWQFTIDEHPSASRDDRPERYQLRDPIEPIEIVDLRSWGDELQLRSAFTGDGITLRRPPMARRILAWLASGVFAGPLLLKLGVDGRWLLDAPEAHRDLARMPLHRLPESEINRIILDEEERWFVSPTLDLGQVTGIQNWMSDAQVARSILARLRKMDPDVVKAIGATDQIFREYLQRVETARFGTADPAVERARADRLRGVHDAILSDHDLLTEAAKCLLETETIRSQVELEVQAKVAQEIEAHQKDVEAAVSDLKKEQVDLQQSIATKTAELAELTTSTETKRNELESVVAEYDQQLASRLEEIAKKPAAFFAESAALRAAFAARIPRAGIVAGRQTHAASVQPAGHPEVVTAEQLDDQQLVRRALATHAVAAGLSLHAMLALHAAFVAGVPPLVFGSRAYDLLHAYALAVAAGRLHWIPVVSSNLEPQDILGRFDSATGKIVPSPSALLDVVKDATESGRLHIVVLEGFNRAPPEGYLLPILQVARAGRVGDTARTIPLAHAGLLPEDDPYKGLARVSWPPSLLIACLATDGTVTLPVPQSVRHFLALLDADDRNRQIPQLQPPSTDTPAPTEIAPAKWKEAVAGAQNQNASEDDTALKVARALALPRYDATDAVRIRDLIKQDGIPAADASDLALAATLIGRANAEANAIDKALNEIGVALPSWRTLFDEAKRLRD